MSLLAEPTTFVLMQDVGAGIKARRIAIGMSRKGLADRAKVDRGRLAALEEGDPSVRETTIGAVERALSQLEAEMGMDEPLPEGAVRVGHPSEGLVEFIVEGNFGVRAVVKGPISNIEELQEAASKLVAGMSDQPEGETTP